MTETGRYYPALRRQLLDVTNPARPSQLESDELQNLAEATDGTILAEAYPLRFAVLQFMANRAILRTAETEEALSA